MIFNVGNGISISLMRFIELLEKEFKKEAIKEYLPMQLGDVQKTFSDIKNIDNWIGFKPKISIENGIKNFVNWYLDYY